MGWEEQGPTKEGEVSRQGSGESKLNLIMDKVEVDINLIIDQSLPLSASVSSTCIFSHSNGKLINVLIFSRFWPQSGQGWPPPLLLPSNSFA